MSSNPEELHLLIKNSNEPLLFKNRLNCELLKWTLTDWSNILKDEELVFRSGVFKHTDQPQWERNTEVITGLFQDFLKHTDLQTNNWLYFDYKYLKNWLTKAENLRKNITWAPLGFPDLTADDCTIWIGSKGAHTPCHVDTYGFNLIFQVYGKKQWVIFPPEENLQPSRIPYEESSIYSRLNFFSPLVDDFKGVNNCRKLVLNPGDVLLLPHKWWHYVENLETAISINVWLPSPEDDKERLNESIVQLLVQQISKSLNEDTKKLILNPNMEQNILENNIDTILETLGTCKNICEKKLSPYKKLKKEDDQVNVTTGGLDHENVVGKYEFIKKIPTLTREEFAFFLKTQASRFQEPVSRKRNGEIENIVEIFNALTDQDVISLISEKLLRNKQ